MSKEKQGCCCTKKCGLITAGIIGAILVILGGMLVFIFDEVFESIVKQNLVIENNTETYDAWVAPPPLYLELYLFNVTNPDEFLAGAERGEFVKPKLQQIGPYIYSEVLKKDQLEFINSEPQELKFRSTGKYYFEPKLSGGLESDVITTVDIIAVGAPAIVEYSFHLLGNDISTVQKQAIYRALNKLMTDSNSKLLFTTTVKELLFGFKSLLLSAIVNTVELLPVIPEGTELPDTFGLFATMNNSAGWFDYKIFTGKGDYSLMNTVTEYEGLRSLPYWFGKECNMINGTDGTTAPAFMNKDGRIYFFVDDICRSMYGSFHQEVDIKGVPGWEYRVPRMLFDAPASSKENECWCPDLSMEVCKYDGGLPLTTCQSGAPVFMTSPHLLYAEHYLQFVEGLQPNEEEHCTPLVYEPSTGICLKADKRLQINLYMEPNSHFDILANSFQTPYAFPVVWLNESYITNDADADAMVKLLVVPEQAFGIAQIVFCIVGGVLLVGVIYFGAVLILNKSVKNMDQDSINSDQKPGDKSSYANDSLEMKDEDEESQSINSIGEPVTAL